MADETLAGGGEMGGLVRAFNWAATPLGPIAGWSRSLRTVVGLLLTTHHPMLLWWGPELIQLYNDAYRASLGPDRHPFALGQRGPECFAETWDLMQPQIRAVMERGEATWHEDHLMPITRAGRLADAYWSYSYSPVRTEDGGIGGVLATVQETTKRVLGERRERILRELAGRETAARSEREAAATVTSVLAQCPADVPYFRLYLREPGSQRFYLAGEAGPIPAGLAGVETIAPDWGSGAWVAAELLADVGELLVTGAAPRSAGAEGPVAEPSPQAMLVPIPNERRELAPDGVLLAGISPHLLFDQEYRLFFGTLATQIGRGVTSARAHDEARTREEALNLEVARMVALFEEAPGFLAVLRGPDLVFRLVNPAYRQMMGHRDLVGKPAREALPELEGQGYFELLDHVYRTGEPFVGNEMRMELQHSAGSPTEVHYFNFVYQAMRTPAGEIWGILVTGHDVTDHVLARETAQRLAAERDAERRQLLTVLEQSPLAIIVAEAPSGHGVYANPKVEEVLGTPTPLPDIAQYSAHSHGFHPDGRPLASEEWPLARAIQRGEVVEQETIAIERGAGHRAEISMNAAPVRDADGRIVAGVAFFHDVTVERRRDQQLRDAQRLQSVGTLAGGVAHEINNQMTVVLSFSEFILQALGPNHPQTPDIRTVLQAGRRAARVSQQLLAFTRRQVSQPHDVALPQLVSELVPVLRQLVGPDKTLVLLPIRSTGRVHADRSQIEQVLINLVANARDATPTGGRVSLAVHDVTEANIRPDQRGFAVQPGNYVRLAVSDNGRGMDAATLARVFEPFYTTKPVGEGTGLGLSMVYGIVKQHGGYIVAESVPGAGTTFELYLPAKAADAREFGRAADAGGADPGPQGSVRQLAATVLVVEDEPAVPRLVVRTLQREGYAVHPASDGAAALEVVRAGTPLDLVITDIIMPNINGRQLYDALAELRPGLPVLFMSGHAADLALLRELIPAGAPFLQKPFTTVELANAVAGMLADGR